MSSCQRKVKKQIKLLTKKVNEKQAPAPNYNANDYVDDTNDDVHDINEIIDEDDKEYENNMLWDTAEDEEEHQDTMHDEIEEEEGDRHFVLQDGDSDQEEQEEQEDQEVDDSRSDRSVASVISCLLPFGSHLTNEEDILNPAATLDPEKRMLFYMRLMNHAKEVNITELSVVKPDGKCIDL